MAYPANKSFMGIDFGTTSCKFGYFINGKVEIFEDEFGNKSMPSYVAFTEDGRLVGEKAKRQMGENPRNTVFAIKKLMGKTFEDAVDLGLQFPFKLIKMDHDLCGVQVHNESQKLKLYPEQIATMLFSKMKYLAEKKLKHSVNAAVISVPPGFNSCQRQATVNAGTIAGFDDVRLVDDSTASATAISYHEMVGREDENVAVVDFGGGFTSASMIIASKTSFKEFPSVTLEFGGIDIDESIRGILKDKLVNQNDSIYDNEKLRLVSEKSKINISFQNDATIIHKNEETSLTSKEVYHHPKIGRKIVKIIENLESSTSGLSTNSDIDQVILTGEYTKTPFVKNQLRKLIENREIKKFEEFPDGVITGAVLESAVQRGLMDRWCFDSILNRTVELNGKILFENDEDLLYAESKCVKSRMILTEYPEPNQKPTRTGKIRSHTWLTIFGYCFCCCCSSLRFRIDSNKIIYTSSSYFRFLLLFSMPSEYLNDFKYFENLSKDKEKKYEDVCRKKLAVINKKRNECFDSCSESFINDNIEEIQKMIINSSISANSDLEELEEEINRLSYVQEKIVKKYSVYLKKQNHSKRRNDTNAVRVSQSLPESRTELNQRYRDTPRNIHPGSGSLGDSRYLNTGSGSLKDSGYPKTGSGLQRDSGYPKTGSGSQGVSGYHQTGSGSQIGSGYPKTGSGSQGVSGYPQTVSGSQRGSGYPQTGSGSQGVSEYPQTVSGSQRGSGYPQTVSGSQRGSGYPQTGSGSQGVSEYPQTVSGSQRGSGYPQTGFGSQGVSGYPQTVSGSQRNSGYPQTCSGSQGVSGYPQNVSGSQRGSGYPQTCSGSQGVSGYPQNVSGSQGDSGYPQIGSGSQRNSGYAQTSVKSHEGGYGNTHPEVKSHGGGYGNTQPDVKSHGGGYGNTQPDVKSHGGGYGNTQPDVKSHGGGYGNTHPDVKSHEGGYGNTQPDVKSHGGGYGNTQPDVKSHGGGYGNTQPDVKSHGGGYGNTQPDVKSHGGGYGNTHPDVKSHEGGYGNTQPDVKSHGGGYGNTQPDVKSHGGGYGNTQPDVKSHGGGYGNTQPDVKSHGGGNRNAQTGFVSHGGVERSNINFDDKKSTNSTEENYKLVNKRSKMSNGRMKVKKTSDNILYPDDISKASPEDCLRLLSSLQEKKQISASTGGLTMGIDFGTSKCCVAALVGRNVEVIANEKCKKTTPSYVTFTDNERYFGEDSKNSALMMIEKTVIEPKNKISKSDSPDSFSVKCKSEDYSLNPVQISSMLIKYMKGVVDNHLGQEVKDAVICVPTYFSIKHRQSIRDAAAIAGLNVLSILNEPTAAAINYKMNNSEEKTKNINILVFDLGSGGLSVALVGIKEDKLKVYGIDGTTEVSGNVIDEKLVNHFKEEILEQQGIEIDSRKETEKLRLVCQKIRYELTGLTSITKLLEDYDGDSDYKCEITKQQFEKMFNDMDEKMIDILDKLFSDSNFPHSQVGEIVMCGGISRVPLMRKFLSDYFIQRGASCKISRTINEDEAVALGAAYHAACLSETKSIDPLHVEDLIINPEGNKRGEKLWIAAPQEGGKLIEIRQKKHIITSSGILWNESSEQNYDMKVLKKLKRDVDVFNINDEEQLQLAEMRNELESKCLNEKRKLKKLLRSKTISHSLANKVMSHCDEVLDSLGKYDNTDLSAMRKHQEEFDEFVKRINDDVKKEKEKKRID